MASQRYPGSKVQRRGLKEAKAATPGSTMKLRRRWIIGFFTWVAIVLYCLAFGSSYAAWISPTWGYLGFLYQTPNLALLTCGYLLASLVTAVSPLIIERVSQLIYWILFLLVYIPSLFVPIFMQFDDSFTLFRMQLALTVAMMLIALSYNIRLVRFPIYHVRPLIFWRIFLLGFVCFNAILLVIFRGALHLASIDEVYTVRSSGSDVTQAFAGVAYVSSLLSGVMNPFLVAFGLSSRRPHLVALGVIGQIIIYATAAMKSVLLSPILIALFYYSLNRDRGLWVPKLGLFVAGICFAVTTMVSGQDFGTPIFTLASVLLMRTFAITGMLSAQYQYFFERNPHTYFSHVHGINLFIHNPYKMPIGVEVGSYFYGRSEGGYDDANAHFFAMDGIAAFGLVGIPLMGALCASMFLLLDSCARRHTLPFAASALTVCIMSLTNSSLFSTFLGGGLMAWMLLFLVIPTSVCATPPSAAQVSELGKGGTHGASR